MLAQSHVHILTVHLFYLTYVLCLLNSLLNVYACTLDMCSLVSQKTFELVDSITCLGLDFTIKNIKTGKRRL